MEQLQGMELHVRNVPAQSTENALRNFLAPYFKKLSIQNFHVQKQRDKAYAQLTFLNIDHARRFLECHGHVKDPRNSRRSMKVSRNGVNLIFLGQILYCERSNRDANPYLLRVLAKEELERRSLAMVPYSHAKPKILPVSFQSSSLSCGAWVRNLKIFYSLLELLCAETNLIIFSRHTSIPNSYSHLR